MKNADIIRSVDTMLSGLTVSDARKEALIRHAVGVAPAPEKGTDKVRVKFRFSLSLPLPHMIVAAIVVVIVLVAPMFVQYAELYSYQSEDEGWYITQGHKGDQQGALAEHTPLTPGVYTYKTLDEAVAFLGGNIPVPTWVPERFVSYDIMVVVLGTDEELSRSLYWTLEGPGEKESIMYEWTYYSQPEFVMNYVEQNEAGEYITLSNGQEIYCSSNYQYESAVWTDGTTEYYIGGLITREEAIRMAESIQP